jgi:hypothetical protein
MSVEQKAEGELVCEGDEFMHNRTTPEQTASFLEDTCAQIQVLGTLLEIEIQGIRNSNGVGAYLGKRVNPAVARRFLTKSSIARRIQKWPGYHRVYRTQGSPGCHSRVHHIVFAPNISDVKFPNDNWRIRIVYETDPYVVDRGKFELLKRRLIPQEPGPQEPEEEDRDPFQDRTYGFGTDVDEKFA